ncbi:hypothetical protein LUU34_00690600 [Aix galericulata]|nr:hypothetical protein LUU34_00690600 [Aix galericulata]
MCPDLLDALLEPHREAEQLASLALSSFGVTPPMPAQAMKVMLLLLLALLVASQATTEASSCAMMLCVLQETLKTIDVVIKNVSHGLSPGRRAPCQNNPNPSSSTAPGLREATQEPTKD